MLKEELKNQKNFRSIMDSLAYPGKINKIINFEKYRGKLYPQTIDLVMTLIDSEVSFNIVAGDDLAKEEIQIRTNAKLDDISNADYIVVPLSQGENIEEFLGNAKRGSLINPHMSSTFIIETKNLKDEGDILMTGPGIKDVNRINFYNFNWITKRNEINADFPMGIDIFLIDESSNLLCIPRTTKIEVGE